MEIKEKIFYYSMIGIMVLVAFDFLYLALVFTIIGGIITILEMLDSKATKLEEEKHKKEWKEYLEKENGR